MLFSLEVLPAKEGDCFILHWGRQDSLALIDGGPSNVYAKTLRPRLESLRTARGAGPLPVELVMVSHVDNDHIIGVTKLFAEMRREHETQTPLDERLLAVKRLWHNTFTDVLGAPIDAYFTATATRALAAVTGLTPNPDTLSKGLEQAGLGEDLSSHDAIDLALVLAGHKEGRRVRDDHAVLHQAGQVQRLNSPFENEGRPAAVRRIANRPPETIEGLLIEIVGPSEVDLTRLHANFQKALKKYGWAIPAALAALAHVNPDTSPTNLSSLVCLVEYNSKRMLLTGDAHGDSVLAGLKAAGRLTGGKLHVEVLKVMHHGSARNASEAFYQAVSADAYVFSGDGKHENPDRLSLEWLLQSRKPEDNFDIVFTYALADIDARRKRLRNPDETPWSDDKDAIAHLIAAKRAESYVFRVVEGATIIDLGDETVSA